MAEGRNIEIKIAASGGEQAAAEVRKVEAAADNLAGENGGKGLKALNAEAHKSVSANTSMRMGLMNVGYQVQDFAVQVASGTSASRAFAQQAPQLLSGFGLIGVAAGTAVALGAPFLEQLLGFTEAADNSGEAFATMAGKLGKAAAEKEKLISVDWVKSLSAEEGEILKQNEALDRNLKLLESKLAAQAKLAAAKADKETAEIDADPNLSEEEKIRRKAAVREGMERKTVEDGVNAEGRAVAAAEADAAAKSDEAKRLADDAAQVAARKAETDAELKNVERRERRRKEAERDLPEAKKQLDEADKKEFMWGSNPLRSDKDQAAARAEAEAARKRVEDLENSAYADPASKIREAELKAKKAAMDAADAKARDEAEKAAVDADRMGKDAGAKREAFESNKGTVVETYQTEAEARRIRTDAAAAEARKRADEKKAAAEKRDADRSDNRNLDDQEEGLDAASRARGLSMRGAGNRGGNKTLQAVGKALADGTDEAELQKLSDMVKEAQGRNGAAMTAMMMQVITGLQEQSRQIEILRKQIKNKNP